MMRKKMVAGNWKMHGSHNLARTIIEELKQDEQTLFAVDVVVIPTFVHLYEVEKLIENSPISLGAQNLYPGESGAFTGEVSGKMLKELGCQYVLVGHSERRQIFHEDLKCVTAKFKAAQQFGLQPILCVGETREQREQNKTAQVIEEQVSSVISEAGIEAFQNAIIAYEPVWAIGTGLTATPDQAQEVHAFIRALIAKHEIDFAKKIRILYGGSVKADNAAGIFAMPDIDGGLVGGASLEAKSFVAICQAAIYDTILGN
jgi:triosephosphate isomerase